MLENQTNPEEQEKDKIRIIKSYNYELLKHQESESILKNQLLQEFNSIYQRVIKEFEYAKENLLFQIEKAYNLEEQIQKNNKYLEFLQKKETSINEKEFQDNIQRNELFLTSNFKFLESQINFHVVKKLEKLEKSVSNYLQTYLDSFQELKLQQNYQFQKSNSEQNLPTSTEQEQQNYKQQEETQMVQQSLSLSQKTLKSENIYTFKKEIQKIIQLENSYVGVLESDSTSILIFDIFQIEKDKQFIRSLSGEGTLVNFTPIFQKTHSILVLASYTTITIYEWKENYIISTYRTFQGLIKDIETIAYNKLVTGGSDLTLKIWEFKLQKTLDLSQQNESIVEKKNNDLNIYDMDFKIKYKYTLKIKKKKTLLGHQFGINMLKSINNKLFLSDDGPRPFKNRLIMWNIKTMQMLKVLSHPSRISQIIPISRSEFCFSYSNNIRYVNICSGKIVRKYEYDFVSKLFKIDPKEMVILGGGSFYNPHEGSMLITDVTNGEVLKKLEKNFEGNVVQGTSITKNHIITINFGASDKYYMKLWSPFL